MLFKKPLAILLALMPFLLFAQVNVKKLDASFNTAGQAGIVYALPRTVIEVEVLVEESRMMAGPLRNYAEDYLGVNEYVRSDASKYKVLDVSINTRSEPDPDHYYHISLAEKSSREAWKTILKLDGNGLLTSVSYGLEEEYEFNDIGSGGLAKDGRMLFQKNAMFNRYARVDTLVRTINIDTVTIEDYTFRTTYTDLPLELKAEELAKKIEKIRNDRYNILTGYQEINYSEGTMQLMIDELMKLEQEYLSLFIGAVEKKQLTYTFTYLPEAGTAGQELPLFRMSESVGISANGGGDQATIKVVPSGNTAALSNQAASANGIYYRLPEQAKIELKMAGRIISESHAVIPQFGKVAVLPPAAYDIELDEDTGGLKSVRIDSQ